MNVHISDASCRCIGCRKGFRRHECHENRFGEYVCKACGKAGIRWSRHRRLQLFANQAASWIGYLVIAAAGFWLFYILLARLSRSIVEAE